MLWKLWELLTGYVKDAPWWRAVQPFVLILLTGAVAETLAYQYLQWRYGLRPAPELFAGSYLAIRIALVTGGALLLLLLLRLEPRLGAHAEPGRAAAFLRRHRRAIVYRSAVTLAVLAAVAIGFIVRSPARVSHITVRFMDLPDDVRPEALAYIVYELNRPQRQWRFDVDFTPFNPRALTSAERDACVRDPQPLLCHAERMAAAHAPVIAITGQPLNGAYFATHRGAASVITTADAARYAPLTPYEFLAYTIVVQSVVIHLDRTGGLPADAFAPESASAGGVFQFAPDPDAVKAAILAARLSPDEELLIFNRFGPEYASVCAQLLSLDWLYADRVKANLARAFGVNLLR